MRETGRWRRGSEDKRLAKRAARLRFRLFLVNHNWVCKALEYVCFFKTWIWLVVKAYSVSNSIPVDVDNREPDLGAGETGSKYCTFEQYAKTY